MGRIHYEPTSSDASGIQPDHARDRSWPVCNCVAMCVGGLSLARMLRVLDAAFLATTCAESR
jgi:hypothetical protein